MTTLPTGTQYWETADYGGNLQRNLNISLIAISTVFFGIKLYVRAFMTKSLGWDDAVAFLAYSTCIVLSALDINVVRYGAGAHLDLIPMELRIQFFTSLATQVLIYFVTTGLVRLAIVTFLPRLSKDRAFIYAVYAVGAIVVIQTVVCFFFKLFSCWPVSDVWKPPGTPGLKCLSVEVTGPMMQAHAIIGIIVDVFLMGLPIWIVYKKMLFSRRTLQVILVFSVGIFAVLSGIIRFWYWKTLVFTIDSTFKMATIGLWTDLECHVGFWCGCFPSLQPVIRSMRHRLGLLSYADKYVDRPTGSRSAYAVQQPSQATNKHGYMRKGSGIDKDGDSDSQKVIWAGNDKGRLTNQDIEMRGLGNTIRKETEVKMLVEDREVLNVADRRQESWAHV